MTDFILGFLLFAVILLFFCLAAVYQKCKLIQGTQLMILNLLRKRDTVLVKMGGGKKR